MTAFLRCSFPIQARTSVGDGSGPPLTHKSMPTPHLRARLPTCPSENVPSEILRASPISGFVREFRLLSSPPGGYPRPAGVKGQCLGTGLSLGPAEGSAPFLTIGWAWSVFGCVWVCLAVFGLRLGVPAILACAGTVISCAWEASVTQNASQTHPNTVFGDTKPHTCSGRILL